MIILRRFSHLSFHSKVLIPVVSLLVALPAVTVYLINQHVEKMTFLEAGDRLATAEGVLNNSLEIRQRALQVQFKNVVNDPRFKAVARLNDEATLRDYLTNYLLPEIDKQVEAIVYTSFEMPNSVSVRRFPQLDLEAFESRAMPGIEIALGGEQSTDFIAFWGTGYDVLSLPAYLPDGKIQLGSLTIGVRLSSDAVEDLKSLTNTELILAAQGEIIGSTLPPSHAQRALATVQSHAPATYRNATRPIVLDEEHFHLKSGFVANEAGRHSPIRYIVLSSYESALDALKRTQTLLLAISFVGIGASVLVIWILVRRITRPLRSLKEGAEAVGEGDFSRRVECDSNDECGALARSFNQMTSNLQTSRRDLECTVTELRTTQGQLIQREARLRESEEGLRLIIEGARDHAIFTLDDEARTLRWNSAAESILGYSTEEARSLDYAALFDQSDRQTHVPRELLDAARSLGQATFEGWRIRKDGVRFWADVTVSRLAKVDGSEGGGFVEIARDITARREAEVAMREARDAAESSDRAKSEFLANMSHEFRTPMNGIIGMSGLLGNLELSDEQTECVDAIRYSAESLLAIIDDVLDIAKIEAGQLDIFRNPSNLLETLEESLQLLVPDCASKSLDLNLIAAAGLPACVDTDASRLRQVIVNLVGNAVKFTPSGGVTVTAAYDETKEMLRVSIHDTGIGIPADKIESLFSPFFQVESSASRQYGGTGLGLAISRNIVELFGGAIEVESELGKGSCFTFTIEAPRVESAAILAPLGPGRALSLTDDPLTGQAIETQLRHWGMSCESLPSSPERVLEALTRIEFDLVVVDHSAARIDTIRSIMNSREQLKEEFPPFVRLLALDTPDELSCSTGCAAVRKPIRPSALHREIRQLLLARKSKSPPLATPPTQATSDPATDKPEKKSADVSGFDSGFAVRFPLKLLVVEDNPINTKVLVKMLKKLGYTPDTAANGEEGLRAAEAIQYDAVLMDLQMPVMDGLESSRRILASETIEHPIYISAFTANARLEDQEACHASGMHDFVSKPARIEALAAVLERAFAWVRHQEELTS